jgi:CO/xanthine dehydrogenase Mo-binding subunit
LHLGFKHRGRRRQAIRVPRSNPSAVFQRKTPSGGPGFSRRAEADGGRRRKKAEVFAVGRVGEWIGRSVPRLDGREKVTGAARFTGDLALPGMLWGAFLRSPHAHALIRRVDASAALALPGVRAVLVGADVAGLGLYGPAVRDRPVLAVERARYAGDPVAAVAAVDEETAREACERIEVEYEPLPAVTAVEEALAPGAPLVHDGPAPELAPNVFAPDPADLRPGSNVCVEVRRRWGDVAAAFAAAHAVFEDEYRFPLVYHCALEPHAALAAWGPDGLRVWSSAQHPYLVRADLAALFGLPLSRVRVEVPYVGGGFGSKSFIKFEPAVAALARAAGAPVLVQASVAEAMATARRHGARIRLRTAVDREGRILARAGEIDLDGGAYADNGPHVARQAAVRLLGPYRTPAFDVVSREVYTHTAPAGSFRSIGAPQAHWACESQLQRVARELGIDPLELRRRNLPERGEAFRPGMRPLDADLRGDLDAAAERLGAGPGRGYAVSVTGGGSGPAAVALVRLHADGGVSVEAGSGELGQGARTVLAQIAAEGAGVPLDAVCVSGADSARTPFDQSTGGSRSTTVMGTAVLDAAREVRRQAAAHAARMWGVGEGEVEVAGGACRCGDGRTAPLPQVLRWLFGLAGGEIVGVGYSGRNFPGRRWDGPIFWESAAGAARVEVDRETGEVRLRRYVSVGDVGRAINPELCEGQEQGAVVMGLGHTLFEEMAYRDGALVNDSLADYRVPGFADLPDELLGVLVENGDGPGPFGAKGMGEGGLVPVAPAVGNALYDLTGVQVRDLPLTPERVWRALRPGDAPDQAGRPGGGAGDGEGGPHAAPHATGQPAR